MAGGVNKVILIGNLGRDPEVRYLEGGVAVANFPIATSETYRDRNSGERITQTEWHSIVLWRGLAEVAEKYLRKGNQVYIEGKLRTRSWDDQNGNTRYTTEVVADNMTMLGGPAGGQQQGNATGQGQQMQQQRPQQQAAQPQQAQQQAATPTPAAQPAAQPATNTGTPTGGNPQTQANPNANPGVEPVPAPKPQVNTDDDLPF